MYFTQGSDARGRIGFSPLQKCTLDIRQLLHPSHIGCGGERNLPYKGVDTFTCQTRFGRDSWSVSTGVPVPGKIRAGDVRWSPPVVPKRTISDSGVTGGVTPMLLPRVGHIPANHRNCIREIRTGTNHSIHQISNRTGIRYSLHISKIGLSRRT